MRYEAVALPCPPCPPRHYLALEGLDRRMHDHVGLEGLLLHKGLEADVALIGAHAGVDQHVPLHVGLQRELSPTHLALELLHALKETEVATVAWLVALGRSPARTVRQRKAAGPLRDPGLPCG